MKTFPCALDCFSSIACVKLAKFDRFYLIINGSVYLKSSIRNLKFLNIWLISERWWIFHEYSQRSIDSWRIYEQCEECGNWSFNKNHLKTHTRRMHGVLAQFYFLKKTRKRTKHENLMRLGVLWTFLAP